MTLFYAELSSDETGPPKQSLDGAPSKVRKNAMGLAAGRFGIFWSPHEHSSMLTASTSLDKYCRA
jgi:hypothetical protein